MPPRLGWKPDTGPLIVATPAATALYRAERYGAMRVALPKSSYDLVDKCVIRDQEDTSACVGFAITGAAHTRLRYLGFDPVLFSPLASYAIGRQKEGIYKGKPLPDEGSYPSLVVAGASEFGLCPEKAWPFDGDHKSRVTQEVNVDTFQKASQFRLSNYARISVSGDERLRLCMHAIAHGHPVPLGMMVGPAFMNFGPGRDPIGVEYNILGGHMTYLCGYEDDGKVLIGCNSYGKGYGRDGLYYIKAEKLLDPSTTDLYDFVISDARA